ncbi:hypothetical protein ACHAWF_007576 [Thalassiosira exigua]
MSSFDEFLTSMTFDEFMTSMTFASGGLGCECDECECGPSTVPPTIREAVNEHSRKRKLEEPTVFEVSKRLQIRQNRELVKREGGFSLWRLELPVDGGDPIVEFRNSHRILFVKNLPKVSSYEKLNLTAEHLTCKNVCSNNGSENLHVTSQTSYLKSIGQGIIGSAAEEKTRQRVDWEEGSCYLLPFAKGIACGWTNEQESCSTEAAAASTPKDDSRNVNIYALKVSPDTFESMDKDSLSSSPCWVKNSHELFSQCLVTEPTEDQDSGSQTNMVPGTRKAIGGFPLSAEQSVMMRLIIELVI